MRDYVQKHLRECLNKHKHLFRGMLDNRKPKLDVNVCPAGNAPEECKDCEIYGDVKLGKNSRMVGCLVGKGVTLIIGDNTVIADTAFFPETSQINAYKEVSINCGMPVTVEIGDNCNIRLVSIDTNLKIGDGSNMFGCFIRRNYFTAANEENSPVAMEIGKNAYMVDCQLFWVVNEIPNNNLKQFHIGDNFVCIDRSFNLASTDVWVGDNCMLINYSEALKGMLEENNTASFPKELMWFDEQDYRNLSSVRERFKYAPDCQVQIGLFDSIRIGDNCYFGTSIEIDAIKNMPNCFLIGNNVQFVQPLLADDPRGGHRSSYQRNYAHYEIGDNCTMTILSTARDRYITRTPTTLIVKDNVNIIVSWFNEACPCSRLEISTDGRYSI